MLHNSEPYGPNEAPTNPGVPIHKPQVGGPLNVAQNLSSLSKLGLTQHQQLLQQFSSPDYTAFDRQNHNFVPQSPNFVNHSSAYVSRLSNPALHMEYGMNAAQNALLPYFDTHSNANLNFPSSFPTKIYQKEVNDSCSQAVERNFPISIPQVPTEFPKHAPMIPEVTKNYIHKSNYYDKEKVSPAHNTSDSNESINLEEHLQLEIKTESNGEQNGHNMVAQCDTSSVSNSREETTQNSVTIEVKSLETVPDKKCPVASRDEKEFEINKSYDTNDEETSESESQNEDGVSIKVEYVLWTDTQYNNPFVQDMYAFTKNNDLNIIQSTDGVTKDSLKNVNIISGETSVDEASEMIKNGATPSSRLYECPHCSVLLEHPKRFLIHVKWHSFGLTNSLRLAREEAKVARQALRRGEVLDVTANDDPEGTFPCKDCEKVFSRITALRNHRMKYHKMAPRDCRMCGQSFADWKEMLTHHATQHPPGERLSCTHCQKTFKYKHTLIKHTQTHFEKKYACEQCPKKYGTAQLLRQHEKLHEKHQRDPAHHCTYCGKGFFERHNLREHEKTHTSTAVFTCDICNTSFKSNGSLRRHMKVSHSKSKSKPYECATCHRCFSTSLIRDRHEQRLHGNQDKFRFTCPKCSRGYRTDRELQQHTCRKTGKRGYLRDKGDE